MYILAYIYIYEVNDRLSYDSHWIFSVLVLAESHVWTAEGVVSRHLTVSVIIEDDL